MSAAPTSLQKAWDQAGYYEAGNHAAHTANYRYAVDADAACEAASNASHLAYDNARAVGPFDKVAFEAGRTRYLVEHPAGGAPVSAPEPTPHEKVWEKLGYAFAEAEATLVYDRRAWKRGYDCYLAEHPVAPVTEPEHTPTQKAWEKAGYANGSDAVTARAAAYAANAAANNVGPFDATAFNEGLTRYRAEHPKEASP